MRRSRGFTLVEILVVIAIITILMAGLVVLIAGVITRARIKRTEILISSIDAACQTYKLHFGVFPPNDMGDSRCLHNYLGREYVTGTPSKDGSQSLVRHPPIHEFKEDELKLGPGQGSDPDKGGPAPVIDAWGREIRYVTPGVKVSQGVDLWSAGNDGAYGNEDDINNWSR